jgi:DNA helicase HerA-like ATPase
MGIMILNKIQLAALKRASVEREKRNEFYLYVDEFQNFATPSFVQMLSEARKYGLSLIMAEQSTSQQKDRNLVDIILANTGTVVTFRSANPRDEQLLLPQFSPYLLEGEISNLPSFHFFMKKAAIVPDEPFSGETMPVDVKKDKDKWSRLIKSSRDQFTIVYSSKQQITKIVYKEESAEKQPKSNTRTGLPA